MAISMMPIVSNVGKNTRMNMLEVRNMGQFSFNKINTFTNVEAIFKDDVPHCECGGVVKPG